MQAPVRLTLAPDHIFVAEQVAIKGPLKPRHQIPAHSEPTTEELAIFSFQIQAIPYVLFLNRVSGAQNEFL